MIFSQADMTPEVWFMFALFVVVFALFTGGFVWLCELWLFTDENVEA